MKGVPALTAVKSSNIGAIGHEGTRLFVRFNNGTVYSYEGISADTYKAGLEAESVGKWFRGVVAGKKFLKHDA